MIPANDWFEYFLMDIFVVYPFHTRTKEGMQALLERDRAGSTYGYSTDFTRNRKCPICRKGCEA